MPWDPTSYLRFGGPRTRPAIDLLDRVPAVEPAVVYDLGCGPGNSTALLTERWPKAGVVGVDRSEAMLGEARGRVAGASFVLGDLATWEPDRPGDVVFSNATLQWLDHHERLLPRVVSWVAPGGVLAVQMPRNYHSPSHMAVGEVAAFPRWSGLLEGVARKDPVAEPAVYLDLVGPLVDSIDLWETEYFHVLEGDDPVLNWLRATLLVPLLDALPLEQHEEFLHEVRENLRRIHPRRPDGTTLYPFRRLFLVATVGARRQPLGVR
ncbi:MAG TPA: methyltransferase domain-containing protein [Acidimicrobiia bacterium]|nr:methyltransferase domain-containing protein [Acidimicrobiia bacterium]